MISSDDSLCYVFGQSDWLTKMCDDGWMWEVWGFGWKSYDMK